MYTYEQLKQFAKAIRSEYHIKCSVEDLIALAKQNDPFYMGTATDKQYGQWFADLWSQFGYSENIHLRRVHYQVISQETPVCLPNGEPYENTQRCWEFLVQASKCARYLEYVDAEAFVDRRNPDPAIYAFWEEKNPSIYIDGEDGYSNDTLTFPEFTAPPAFHVWDYEASQAYHLEIWCEKSTMNDVLKPLCQRYNANLVTGIGEQSITSTIALVHRATESDKPVRVLYVSDFDPAGKSMPVAVSRKAEYYIRKLHPDVDFRLFPVVLTEEQVGEYRLPRTPIKNSERRKDRFEEVYGEGAVELDALEALHPGTLRGILAEHLDCYYDHDLWRRVYHQKQEMEEDLTTIRQDILDKHDAELIDLEAEYEEIKADFEHRMASYNDKQQALYQTIREKLTEQQPDIDEEYPLPKPEQVDEVGEGLYNSQRSYEEQLIAYKDFQGKGNGRFATLSHVLTDSDVESLVEINNQDFL